MQRYVVVSVDYEIFGNGLGDVRQHITEPTERMARICEKHGVPLVVYVETEEALAFEKFRNDLNRDLGYDASKLVREQVRELASRGHDIQLHLHPEWVGSRYHQGRWELDFDKHAVDDLFETQEETTRFMGERIAALEEMASRSTRAHKVRAYRAGAFSAQPGRKLLGALRTHGIPIDSSVVHGLQHELGKYRLDYRNAPAGRRLWRVSDAVDREDVSGQVWEISIQSKMSRRIFQATFRRFAAKFSKNVPKEKQKQMVDQLGIRKHPLQFLKFLFQPVPIKFDFHNVAPSKLYQWIRNSPPPKAGDLDVIMLIGHTKEHISDADFDEFLRQVTADPELKVVSLTEIAAMLENNGAGKETATALASQAN